MIIDLKKYREHGYLKALRFIALKMFYNQSQKVSLDNKLVKSENLFRNYPRLISKDNNQILCISCALCEKACPEDCIEIKSSGVSEDLKAGPRPHSFKIDLSKCSRCMTCIDVCPTNALDNNGVYSVDEFVHTKELLSN